MSYYVCAALAEHPRITHAFSTRPGGVSFPPEGALNLGLVPWDAPENVEENRRRFFSALGLRPEYLATVAQTHSPDFHIINGGADQWNPRTPGDALLTAQSRVAVAVKTADCFPILISEARTGSIAAVHAGWRGTLASIVRKTIEGMGRHFGAAPGEAVIAIGPGIRSCCLEVGPEVEAAFHAAFPGSQFLAPHPDRSGKFMLDLPRALKHQLGEAGVPPSNIFDLEICTRCHTDQFFSYRAEGARTGRLLAVICKSV